MLYLDSTIFWSFVWFINAIQKVENVRRKHNYLPLIVEILKLLGKEGKLVPLVEKVSYLLRCCYMYAANPLHKELCLAPTVAILKIINTGLFLVLGKASHEGKETCPGSIMRTDKKLL